jgi:hypothetical protein
MNGGTDQVLHPSIAGLEADIDLPRDQHPLINF